MDLLYGNMHTLLALIVLWQSTRITFRKFLKTGVVELLVVSTIFCLMKRNISLSKFSYLT